MKSKERERKPRETHTLVFKSRRIGDTARDARNSGSNHDEGVVFNSTEFDSSSGKGHQIIPTKEVILPSQLSSISHRQRGYQQSSFPNSLTHSRIVNSRRSPRRKIAVSRDSSSSRAHPSTNKSGQDQIKSLLEQQQL